MAFSAIRKGVLYLGAAVVLALTAAGTALLTQTKEALNRAQDTPLLSAATAEERARDLLERVGLGKRAEHMPNELSGGQRQRVAIARALANEPPLLLADEPTGNLDTAASVEIMELFSQLHKEGTTVVVVTHEEEIAAFTNRIIRFRDGLVVSDQVNVPVHAGSSSGAAAPEDREDRVPGTAPEDREGRVPAPSEAEKEVQPC